MHEVHAAPVPGTSCTVFPADNVWNTDISSLPVHPRSAAWMSAMNSGSTRLHPDFGGPYGLPFAVVGASHPDVSPDFLYDDESDPGPYPFGADTPIEGGEDSDGDRHALMIDRDSCVLYELWAAYWNAGNPEAGSGAIFDLRSNDLRPRGWTSADAAGLPVFAGLVRWDEVVAGEIRHAIRFTAQRTDRSYLWPARHQAGAASDPNLPPMGARFRLKASYDISAFSPETRVILAAMKRYGMILADNGSNWFFQGTEDPAWPDRVISELKTVPAAQFEAIDESSLMVDPDSGRVAGGGGTPQASLSRTSYSWGSWTVGTASTTRDVVVTSASSATLAVGTVSLGGTNPGDFQKRSDGCTGRSLAPGATCRVTFRFRPTTTGLRTAALRIPTNAAGSPHVVSLAGTGR